MSNRFMLSKIITDVKLAGKIGKETWWYLGPYVHFVPGCSNVVVVVLDDEDIVIPVSNTMRQDNKNEIERLVMEHLEAWNIPHPKKVSGMGVTYRTGDSSSTKTPKIEF